ncbi:DDE_superfamily endonuclease domain-containing protein [Hexamita inflata]|uniref:DDE superfamily endonuclease domain-containing protein n=1 Tax=Hexamita inflata TaxID=28002 RepID=A0AA86NAX9_9EUKA|nr:DDE superfamily endonuclease domain-containing protein [Hexamita inflata]
MDEEVKHQLSADNRLRVVEIVRSMEGIPEAYQHASDIFDISVRTVYRIMAAHKENGRYWTMTPGRPSFKFTQGDRLRLRNLAISNPFATLNQLAWRFHSLTGKKISHSRVSQILKTFDLNCYIAI